MSENLPASVLARLRAENLRNAWDPGETLVRYATEGFLRRLSRSPHRGALTLKGGNLFVVWQGGIGYRPTMDTDFLCRGDASPERLADVFRDIATVDCSDEDGLVFDPATLAIEPIRAQTAYGGSRLSILARLGRTRIVLHFDVGVGDAVWPPAKVAEFPALLDAPPPRVRMYPKETAIAEKVHAMVELGEINSRMKDFYDVWFLASRFPFDFPVLRTAMEKTFSRRGVWPVAAMPPALAPAFAETTSRRALWTGFLRRTRLLDSAPSFPEACALLRTFLLPVILSGPAFSKWVPDKGWT